MAFNRNDMRVAKIVLGFIAMTGVAVAQAPADKPSAPSNGQQTNIQICGAQWKEKKKEAGFNKETDKWSQFWSNCNKQLKAAKSPI
jgi:hypothetical protein